MKWTVRKITDTSYQVHDQDGQTKAEISQRVPGGGRWVVRFDSRVDPEMNAAYSTLHEAVAHVRGVEAAVRVYGKETGR